MVVSVDEDERIVAIRPDKEDIHTRGFACFKGLVAPEAHAAANRILHPLKRQSDGTFQRIGIEQALDEIAAKLKEIVDRDGPEAVGGYWASGAGFNSAATTLLGGLLGALGSPKLFSSMTIDQSAKSVAAERLGIWPPGPHPFHGSEVTLLFGANPILSFVNTDGHNAPKKLKEEIAKGMKLLVVDPRRTETARLAHVFLQPLPGEDATIIAGMIRLIFEEGWEDKEFLARYATQVDELQHAVRPFTPEYVARRADVPVETFIEITRTFACAKRGKAMAGVGPSMAPHSNLAEHLIQCLTVVCGRFLREGEKIENPGFLTQRVKKPCQVIPAARSYDKGYKSRVGDYGLIPSSIIPEMPTGIMADEILEPGSGQVKAFFVHGGNPAVLVPDQIKMVRALRSLELLVTIDPYMTPTAKLSHYVLPTLLQYERPDFPLWQLEQTCFPYYSESFTRYTPAVAKPPPGSEIVHDVHIFWGLAKRLDRVMTSLGVPLDMSWPPTADDLLAIVARHAPIPFDEIRRHPLGVTFQGEPQCAEPGNGGPDDRFTLAPPDVVEEIRELAGEDYLQDIIVSSGARATHRFIVRRQRYMYNSQGYALPSTKRRAPYNTAKLHPDDLAALGIASGDPIRISSELATVEVVAEADDTLRPGIVSMSHGFGILPEESDYRRDGVCSNLLISTDKNLQTINAMPRMTAFPVAISPADRPVSW
jgi:anaerobic selenocysteine-containing dehydrogenase